MNCATITYSLQCCSATRNIRQMPAPKEILILIELFQHNRDSYCSTQYNETQLRPEFVNPFFKVLGRDADNKQGYVDTWTQAFNGHHMQVGHLF